MIDLFHALELFQLITETGSFSAAAREGNSSQSAVTRSIANLEAHFGVRLLHRSTRRLTLTEDGQELLRHAAQLLTQVKEMEGAIGGHRAAPTGLVRVGLPAAFSVLLMPRMGILFARHPGLSVEFVARDRPTDLVEDRLDVALQIGRPAETSLVARVVAALVCVPVAAPEYLDRQGTPQCLADLAAHDCIIQEGAGEGTIWRLHGPAGDCEISVSGPLRTSNGVAALRAAVAGYGVALLPEPLVANDIRAGRLHRLLAEYAAQSSPIYLIYRSRQHLAARTRVVIDFLVEQTRLVNEVDLTGTP